MQARARSKLLSLVHADRANAYGRASQDLDIPLPEICFGRNSLVIKHTESQLEYVFDGLSALQAVDSTGEASGAVKVAYAADWAKSRKLSGASDPVGVVKNWDWTYTTTHPGRLENSGLVSLNRCCASVIVRARIHRPLKMHRIIQAYRLHNSLPRTNLSSSLMK